MLLAATDPFYAVTPDKLWGDGIRPAIMTDAQLTDEMRKGASTYNALYPPNREGLFGTPVGWIIIAAACVGAVALTYGGTAAAGQGAASLTTTTAGTAGTSTAGAATASGLKAVATAQKIAQGVSAAGRIGKAVGVELPDKLTNTADFLADPKSGAAQLVAGLAINELRDRHNLKLDAKGQDALRERIDRERLRQAAKLRVTAAAAEQAGAKKTPRTDWYKMLGLAIPVILFLAGQK